MQPFPSSFSRAPNSPASPDDAAHRTLLSGGLLCRCSSTGTISTALTAPQERLDSIKLERVSDLFCKWSLSESSVL